MACVGFRRSLVLAALAFFAVSAAPARANECTGAKFKASGKAAARDLKCEARADAKGAPVDPACGAKTSSALAAGFTTADAKGPCVRTPAEVQTALDNFESNANTALGNAGVTRTLSKCDSKKLAAMGKKASRALACYSKSAARDLPVDSACLTASSEKFSAAIAKAVARGDCSSAATAADLATVVDDFVTVVNTELSLPFVSAPVAPVVLDVDLRTLPTVPPWAPGDPIIDFQEPAEPERLARLPAPGNVIGSPATAGQAIAAAVHQPLMSSACATDPVLSDPIVNFDGIFTGVRPPDTNGDVGPSHYMQARNSQFAVYSKQGSLLAGPFDLNAMWMNTNDADCMLNSGDPVVKYDRLADRWLLASFRQPNHVCIAISQGPDPVTGGWFLYKFTAGGSFPDYIKIGVWPDAYYMGANIANAAWAFDRDNMLTGSPAGVIWFATSGFMLPSDLDGSTLPPAGAPNVFLRLTANQLELSEFRVNFTVPLSSSFVSLPNVQPAPFDYDLCLSNSSNLCGQSPYVVQCIPQPGTSQLLFPLSVVPMYRLPYRNVGGHETLLVNHTVDVDGTDRAGIRWYELRKTAGVWSIFQWGTHSPDATHRWMGSMAMDQVGNIAMGYSVSSVTVFPGIRYAGRLAVDSPGTMPQGEGTILDGTASQTGGCRWGDYSALSVDPVDDCTFWYTTEYIPYAGAAPATRIGSFRFLTCPCLMRPPDLVSWWPLDETSGATSLQDIVGGNNATPFGSPVGGAQAPQPVSGMVDGAIRFPKFGNGLSGARVAPQGALAAIGSADFTIDAWVQFEPAPADRVHYIVNKFDSPSNKGYALYITSPGTTGNERLAFRWGDGSNVGGLQTITSITPGEWHHVAITFARSVGGYGLDIRLYVDGCEQGVQVGNPPGLGSLVNFNFLEVGWQPSNVDQEITLDELEVFDRALAQSEIMDIFEAGSAGKCK